MPPSATAWISESHYSQSSGHARTLFSVEVMFQAFEP
jgi:hypothetical protein